MTKIVYLAVVNNLNKREMEVVVLSALSILGLHNAVDTLVGHLTGRSLSSIVDKWSSDTLRLDKWLKPVILCPVCMSSVWGTIFYFTFSFFYGGGVLGWIPSVFAIAGAVTVLNRFR